MQRFGTRVREIRRDRRMTLEEVSRRAKIRRGYLSGIENGRVNPPSPRVVRGLARALQTDTKELLLMATVQKAPREIKDELARAVNGKDA